MGTSLSYNLYQQCTSCTFSQILLVARVKKADNDISSTSLSALENRLTYYKKVVNSILFFCFFSFSSLAVSFLHASCKSSPSVHTEGALFKGSLQSHMPVHRNIPGHSAVLHPLAGSGRFPHRFPDGPADCLSA